MSIYTVKRYSLYKFIGLSFALIYGFFIVGSLQYLYSVGSGDINAYIDFLKILIFLLRIMNIQLEEMEYFAS